jgi:hypothetical protein
MSPETCFSRWLSAQPVQRLEGDDREEQEVEETLHEIGRSTHDPVPLGYRAKISPAVLVSKGRKAYWGQDRLGLGKK